MYATPELRAIQAQKQVLVAKSDIYRCTLALDCARLREPTERVERAVNIVRAAYPALLVLAPLAGYSLIKQRSFFQRLWMRALLAWELYHNVWPRLQGLFSKK